jgi:anti-sigma factor (TIGR02949 family)
MSLEHMRSECSDVAGSLQPYVDGELTDDEQEKVAEHLERCSGCRSAVSEQMWVRATLRTVEREQAPRGLQAKLMLRLDEVDREAVVRPGLLRRIGARTRDLFRGGLVMLPAGAVAAALFFVARGGLEETPTLPVSPMSAALPVGKSPAVAEKGAPNLGKLEPQVGFPIQVAKPQVKGVQLVGAQLDETAKDRGLGARLRYRLRTGDHIIDRQRPAGGPAPIGTPVTFRGNQYLVGRTDDGEPVVHFERSGVAHMLRLEGAILSADEQPQHEEETSGDFSILLDMADQLHPR